MTIVNDLTQGLKTCISDARPLLGVSGWYGSALTSTPRPLPSPHPRPILVS